MIRVFENPRTLLLALFMLVLIMTPLLYIFRGIIRFSRDIEWAPADDENGVSVVRPPSIDYAMTTVVEMDSESAVLHTKQAVSEEGLGIVAEFDVADILRASGVAFRPYKVLTIWDGLTMSQIVKSELAAGLLMPARIIIFEVEGGTAIAAVDPRAVLKVANNPSLLPLAVEARAQLQRVIDRLEVGTVTLS